LFDGASAASSAGAALRQASFVIFECVSLLPLSENERYPWPETRT